jgi:hypothetical protein
VRGLAPTRRRRIVSIAITSHPTAEWIARQITDAFPWQEAPYYLLRDRDGVYGDVVRQRLAAMGIRDRPIAARVSQPVCGRLQSRFRECLPKRCVEK